MEILNSHKASMKSMKLMCVCCLIGMVAGAHIARGAEFRNDINPALIYYQAISLAPELSAAEREYLFVDTEWRVQRLPDRFGDLLARYDNQFKLVRQAAQSTVPCDWGVDMSAGPLTLLPHLRNVRGIAQAGRLRAKWALQQGRQADACEELLAVLALGRNAAHDGILISALVQIAAETMVCETIAENFHQFTPESLKQLADGFAAAPARGTVAACIPVEKTTFLGWLENKIVELQKENPGNDAKVMAGISKLVSSLQGSEEGPSSKERFSDEIARAAGGTSEGVLKLLHEEVPLCDRLAQVLALPPREYEEQMRPLLAEIQNSSNPLIKMTFPSFDKCRQKEFAIQTALAMVQAAVEYRLRGEEEFKSVVDPCGDGPFGFQRFIFEGVDRGFQLKSVCAGRGFPETLIFVEKEGTPFYINGQKAGQPVPKSAIGK
jgi:hypothetical protein